MKFDLTLLALFQDRKAIPFITLSGGITSESIGHASHRVRPFGVDIDIDFCIGVELEPGIKLDVLIKRLIQTVQDLHRRSAKS